MRDGVYPVQFCGAPAFKVVWRGKALPMLWGSEAEAKRHLWLLNHPGTIDEIMASTILDAGVTVEELWDLRRARDIRARYKREMVHG